MPTRSERRAAHAARAAQRRNRRLIVVGLLVVAVVAAATGGTILLTHRANQAGDPNREMQTLDSGLQFQDVVVGTGQVATPGDALSVHYTGWLTDGTKFDSSKDRGQPFEFTLGQGQVIQGWDQGLNGMRVGSTRRLTIPPELGYGAGGTGGVIPPNATLIFEVELLTIK